MLGKINKRLDKDYFLDLSKKLSFKLEDDLLDLLLTYSKSIQQDLALLQSYDVDSISLFYVNENLCLSLGEDVVDEEKELVSVLKSLVDGYKISNIGSPGKKFSNL